MTRTNRALLVAVFLAAAVSPAIAAAQRRAPSQGASAAAARPATQIFTGRVVAVPAGDTLRVLRGERAVTVRLRGVAAPAPRQRFGAQARQFMITSVLNKSVRVEVKRTERGGALVADVWAPTTAAAVAGPGDAAAADNPVVPARSGNLDPTGTQRDLPRGLPGSQIETPPPSPAATEQNLAQALLWAGLARLAGGRADSGDRALADAQAEARKTGQGLWAGMPGSGQPGRAAGTPR
jgi:endonuclease YncB( thermonuclease family)